MPLPPELFFHLIPLSVLFSACRPGSLLYFYFVSLRWMSLYLPSCIHKEFQTHLSTKHHDQRSTQRDVFWNDVQQRADSLARETIDRSSHDFGEILRPYELGRKNP